MATTTRPKGATSYKETVFGIIPRSRLLKLEVKGTKKGLEYLLGLISKSKSVVTSPQFICRLHGVALGWIFPNWAGKYRKAQVTFSGKEAVPYYQLPELVANLCLDLRERIKRLPKPEENTFIVEVVKLLAWFQHKFVLIHPFLDYNGRIARMLTILILLKLDLPPMELKADTKTDRKRYIKALQDADAGNLITFESLISQALKEALDKFRR